MNELTAKQEDDVLEEAREGMLCECCGMKNKLDEQELCKDCI